MTTTRVTTTRSTYVPRRSGRMDSAHALAIDVDDAIARLAGDRELISAAVAPIAAGGPDADIPATTGVLVTAIIRERT